MRTMVLALACVAGAAFGQAAKTEPAAVPEDVAAARQKLAADQKRLAVAMEKGSRAEVKAAKRVVADARTALEVAEAKAAAEKKLVMDDPGEPEKDEPSGPLVDQLREFLQNAEVIDVDFSDMDPKDAVPANVLAI